MKYFLSLFSLFILINRPIDSKPFVVVQLFTSQGCSSCPPADKLAKKIAAKYKEKNVYVMSYHVDYWNRLGWKDPFSKKEFTEIQYRYADQFRERRVYTPQIVVNGKEHFVGSNEGKLRRRIQSYLKKKPKNTIDVVKSRDTSGNVILNFTVNGNLDQKKLKLAFILEKSVTKVTKGENTNETLINTNIVLEEIALRLNERNKGSLTIPKGSSTIKKELKIFGFVQNEKLEITGATQIDL